MQMIFGIDFDGTIVEDKWPEIGAPKQKVVDYIKQLQNFGHKWILWICRSDEEFPAVLKWCEEHGLHPDYVNPVDLPPVNDCMDFGTAIRMLKDGAKIARKGWHGRNQFIFLADTVEFHTFANLSDSQDVSEVHDMIVLKTSDNTFQLGWMAKQADLLAEDWYVVK